MSRLFRSLVVTGVIGLSVLVATPSAQALAPDVTTLTGLHSTLGVAFSPDGSTAYVLESDDGTMGGPSAVTVVNTRTKSIVGSRVSVGGTGGASNHAIAMAPDGTKAYISLGNGTVKPFFPQTLTFGPAITVGSFGIGQVVFSPDGETAYVAVTASGSGNTVAVIDVATDSVVTTVVVGGGPNGLAITPDGTRVFVNCGDGSVWVIETTGNTAATSFTPSGHAQGTTITITPDGARVYVTAFAGGGPDSFTSVVDTTTYATVHQFSADEPKDVEFDSDGATAYLMSAALGQIIPTDSITFSAGTPITVTEPSSTDWFLLDKNPQASQLYVTGGNWVIIVGDGPALADTGASSQVTTVLTGAALVAIVGGVLLVARRRRA